MRKKQLSSFDSLELEKEVVKGFNKAKKIKTVWHNIIKLMNNYFSPLATLCFVIAIGSKNQIVINPKELNKLLNNWKFDPIISSTEEYLLSNYKKYLDKLGFRIPKPNMSMPFNLRSSKSVYFQGKEVQRKMTKKEIADKQMSFSFVY